MCIRDSTYIDRDKLYNVQDDTCVIGNGWYLLDEKRHSISESVNFLPVSIHIANQNDKSAKIIANLAHRNMPVGCRDLSTMEFLQSHGIEAYFSSCLTTTLSRDFILKDCKEKQERKGIIFADARIDKLKIFPVTRLLDQWKKRTNLHQFTKSFTISWNALRATRLKLPRTTVLLAKHMHKDLN